MTTQSMKGLLKGLRYISQIFDEKEEGNIEIGFPTDVKHVAHIGSDGPSHAQPTWMNEFSDTSKQPTQSTQATEASTQGNGQQNIDQTLDSPTRRRKSNKKQSRRHGSSDGGLTFEPASPEPNSNPTTTTTTTTTTTKPRRHKTSSGESPARARESSSSTTTTTTTTTTTRNAKAPTNRKKSGSDKLPRPKTRDSRSSGQGSSDVTNEMTLDLVVEEGDDDIDGRANKSAL